MLFSDSRKSLLACYGVVKIMCGTHDLRLIQERCHLASRSMLFWTLATQAFQPFQPTLRIAVLEEARIKIMSRLAPAGMLDRVHRFSQVFSAFSACN